MPMLVLTSKLVPPGLEATTYALLAGHELAMLQCNTAAMQYCGYAMLLQCNTAAMQSADVQCCCNAILLFSCYTHVADALRTPRRSRCCNVAVASPALVILSRAPRPASAPAASAPAAPAAPAPMLLQS